MDYLITSSNRQANDYYLQCSRLNKPCLKAFVGRRWANIWLNMWTDEDHNLSKAGVEAAEYLLDWYVACAWRRLPHRKPVFLSVGEIDVSIGYVPKEDAEFLCKALDRIQKQYKELRYKITAGPTPTSSR